MRLRPAGTETRAPTPGIKCPTRIAFPPLRSNTSLALSKSDTKSSFERSKCSITRRKRASLSLNPTAYMTNAAHTLAAVAVSSTGTNERRPLPIRNPNSGNVSSVGTGTYMLPANMRTNTPTYPSEWTTSMTHRTTSVSTPPIVPYPPISSPRQPNYAPCDAPQDPGHATECAPQASSEPTHHSLRLGWLERCRCPISASNLAYRVRQ